MRYVKYIFMFIFCLFIFPLNVHALTSSEYQDRNVCSNYEVAIAKEGKAGDPSSTYADTVGCYGTYNEAVNAMNANTNKDVIIFERNNGKTKIVNAKYALVDLTLKGSKVINYYPDTTSTTSNSYMVNNSSTGAVDGAFLGFDYSSRRALVKVAGYKGWTNEDSYEIVPLVWVYSIGFYRSTGNIFKHNFAKKISNTLSSYYGIQIGPLPEGLFNNKNYYSYDAHYFYTDQYKMIDDYKNNNYNNAVNKNVPYYNYYQYLPNHSKTNYSAANINKYIRDGLEYTESVYGNTLNIKNQDTSNVSKLYGMGTYLIYAESQYGGNAILSLGLGRNESNSGRSNIAISKNNGYGQGAVDSSPFGSAYGFLTYQGSIYNHAQHFVTDMYQNANHYNYNGGHFGNKQGGWNVGYASDPFWGEKAASYYYRFDKYYGLQDYNYYQLAINTTSLVARASASNSSKAVYNIKNMETPVIVVAEVTGDYVAGSNVWYKIVSDMNLNSNKDSYGSYASKFDWENSYVYVPSAYFKKINTAKSGLKDVSDVYPYQGRDYQYSYYNDSNTLTPKVGLTTNDTMYYYDGGLLEETGKKLLKNKYVMVYDRAVDTNNKVVSYLVSSDYKHDQKEWVSAANIKLVGGTYGKQTVIPVGYSSNVFVSANEKSTIVSGIYDGTYLPVLGEKVGNDGKTYLKVPISLTSNDNSYGYTLKTDSDASISLLKDNTVPVNNVPVISAKDTQVVQGKKIDLASLATAFDTEDGDLTASITYSGIVDFNTPGKYVITYKVVDSLKAEVTKQITITVIADLEPVINANDVYLSIGDTFKEKENVSAYDNEDKDITSKIKVVFNNVDTSKEGTYKVSYEVVDSFGHKVVKEIKVIVEKEKTDEEKEKKDGEFYLNDLSFNKTTKKYSISGYLIIKNINNRASDKINYYLVLKNKVTAKTYKFKVQRWTTDVPFDLGSENGYDYSSSWFKGEIDFGEGLIGDYDLYMEAATNSYYSLEKVTNVFNKDISRRNVDGKYGYNFKVNLSSKAQEIELNIRESLITTSTSNTYRNMINNYDDISFVDKKLKLVGTSYNYGISYEQNSVLERSVIFEETTSFKQYKFDLGSTNKGSYDVLTSDNKNKDFVWYDKSLDISSLEKGRYAIIVYTKTKDVADYGEVSDVFGMINDASAVINNKKYSIILNKERNNRIELIVE